MIIANAFSLSMLPAWRRQPIDWVPTTLRITPVADIAGFISRVARAGHAIESAVGHADTAALYSRLTGIDLPVRRQAITLADEDVLLIGQYIGPRLPEGTTTLPEGAVVQWFLVRVHEALHEVRLPSGQYRADELEALLG